MSEATNRSPEPETYPTPEHGWVCFHCGEHFPGNADGTYRARLHFGPTGPNDEPKCQITAYRLRAMEAELRRYREEDTELHQEIARLKCEHATALRREEEKGYERGLRDAQRYPETIGLMRAAS